MAGPLLSRSEAKSYRKRPMAEINITPFVDVMLVLLVVFMVTAPLITQGVSINLPEVDNEPITEQKEPIQISIKAGGAIYIQAQKVKRSDLPERLKAIRGARKEAASILLNADKSVDYGTVMSVMSELQTAGLVDVGLVTAPPKN
ncbi:MAG: protein TolR [Pseudomonadota bacterium]|nr:protein TolR [Magnetococcales bacterium]MEC8467245.1 protein TolR [Pseudomonadota bacterium]|tara:strand:+ start:13542 stop:13976 length:435 start_codon:yes stop_codon:yes gene_type:complete